MQMPKATEDDKERFRSLLPDDPRVEVKPMFGNLGAFVGGNMFAGLFGEDVGVKLPDDELARLREAGARPFGPEGRPMGGYVTVEGPDAGALVEKALDHVATLPPKAPKAPKARASRSRTTKPKATDA